MPRLLPAAERELRDAMEWYENQRVGLGTEFLAAVDAALGLIGESPERFASWAEHPGFRRFILNRFPYLILYRLSAGEPQIVAIAHSRRRPGYWTARVPEAGRTPKIEEAP